MPNDFLTMKIFNELFHFDIFLQHVFEIWNFDHIKIKTILFSIYGINCEKLWPLDFFITILDDQLYRQKNINLEKKRFI